MSKFKVTTKPSNTVTAPLTVEKFTADAAMVQSQSGGRPLKPIRINFDLDPETHRALKIRAINQGLKVAELIRGLIAKELNK